MKKLKVYDSKELMEENLFNLPYPSLSVFNTDDTQTDLYVESENKINYTFNLKDVAINKLNLMKFPSPSMIEAYEVNGQVHMVEDVTYTSETKKVQFEDAYAFMLPSKESAILTSELNTNVIIKASRELIDTDFLIMICYSGETLVDTPIIDYSSLSGSLTDNGNNEYKLSEDIITDLQSKCDSVTFAFVDNDYMNGGLQNNVPQTISTSIILGSGKTISVSYEKINVTGQSKYVPNKESCIPLEDFSTDIRWKASRTLSDNDGIILIMYSGGTLYDFNDVPKEEMNYFFIDYGDNTYGLSLEMVEMIL